MRCWFCFLITALLLPLSLQAREGLPEVSIIADNALTVPLTLLAGSYTKKSHVTVTLTFAPAFEQEQYIEEGEPVDVLLTAHPKLVDTMQQKGLYDVYSVMPIIESRLSLVTSKPDVPVVFGLDANALKTLRNEPNFLLAVANEAVSSEGYYTSQIMKNMPRGVFLAGKTVQLQDTGEVLDFMLQMPSYGVLFESDALQYANLRTVAPFPREWHDPAVFTGLVVAGGQMATARSFLNYLKSPEAQRVFIKYGFYATAAKAKNPLPLPKPAKPEPSGRS